MAIILKGSPSASINTSHKLQPKQPGVELLDNGYSRLKIGSTTNLSNLDDSSGWIEWADLPYATPNPQIYTDTKINFAPYVASTEQNIINFGANYHQIYGYSVGMQGGISVVRAGYNGNNRVELSADGTNWVVIGPSTLYPTSSTMTLGTDTQPFQTLWLRQNDSSNNEPIGLRSSLTSPSYDVYIKPATIGPMEGGFVFGRGVGGTDTNSISISAANSLIGAYSRNTWIKFNDSSITLGLGSGFTDMYSIEFTADAVLPRIGTGQKYKTLGNETYNWQSVYIRDICVNYNETEECLEFLAS